MATDAEKVKMYREKAKDTSVPQEVRNTYLDRANELERKAYEDTKKAPTPPVKLAKGGMAKKAPAKAPAKAASKKPVVAIMIGMAKPKGKAMMNKGGMAKKGKC